MTIVAERNLGKVKHGTAGGLPPPLPPPPPWLWPGGVAMQLCRGHCCFTAIPLASDNFVIALICYIIFKTEIYILLTSRKDTTPINITFCYHFNSIKITLCSAVCPSLSQSLTSAPYLIRTFTTVMCPEYAALCREVALPDLV